MHLIFSYLIKPLYASVRGVFFFVRGWVGERFQMGSSPKDLKKRNTPFRPGRGLLKPRRAHSRSVRGPVKLGWPSGLKLPFGLGQNLYLSVQE